MTAVLMVTGVYHPEVSGAANQCRQLMNALREQVSFEVLTMTRDPNFPRRCQVDGVDVVRFLWKKGARNYCIAILKFAAFFLSRREHFQIVHLHGFSLKSVLVVLLSKIFHKKIIIKMTSVGHDDPISMRQRGFLHNHFFSLADAYVGTSPLFRKLYCKSQLPLDRLKQIPNGVDTNRFHPVKAEEKAELRDQLGLPGKMKLILFVGHFSLEKSPNIFLEGWMQHVAEKFPDTGIIYIGSNNLDHYEVDADLVRDMQKITESYLNKRVFFIERTHEIEKYFQAVDMFVLPSLREGLPNALLEAMACGLPVITSRLEGVTDWIVEDGKNGLLLKSVIGDDLGKALISMLKDEIQAHLLGLKARETVLERFSMEKVAEEYLELYRRLTPLA
jgi:glycosyltransferase involved in cell wall biosynthesis